MRLYLSSFGIESPPLASGERTKSESTLNATLEQLALQKPRPTVVYVWAPAPFHPGLLAKAMRALRRRHIELRWSLPPLDWADAGGSERDRLAAIVAGEAARLRANAARVKGERALRRLGVRIGALP